MLESRIIANLMKIDIALIQSHMNLALTINVFQVEFENTIHPQKVWSVTLFSLPQVHPIASYPCSQMLIKK